MNLALTQEQRAYLQSIYKRTMSMAELEIIEEKLPESKKFERAISFDDMDVQTGMSKENKLVLRTHDDRSYIGKSKMPSAGSKILSYKIYKFALGLVTIEVFGGERMRGEELRSEKFIRSEKQKFYFVYLEDKGYYQQYDEIKNTNKLSDNQEIAYERMEESDSLYPMFIPFIWAFEEFLKSDFVFAPSIFSDERRIEESIESYKRLLPMINDYIMIQFIFGQITASERDILFEKNNLLLQLVRELYKNWRIMSENEREFFYHTKLSPFAKQLVDPRKVDVSVELNKLESGIDHKSAKVILYLVRGYLLNEREDDFAPALLEIPRRIDLAEEHGKQSEEDRFLKLLKNSIGKNE